MNAYTSSDHTTYPFATTNPQDFKNLMSVYLDATLNPLLNADDYAQEGWRIGPENPLASNGESPGPDTESKLIFKGVVYNEMKGMMSDASYLFYIRFQDHFFPSINNSGGDPQKMTELTHDQLQRFHSNHYHPSNAKIFTYGDMSLLEHLQELDRRLGTFNRNRRAMDFKVPIRLDDGPINVAVKGPVDPLMDKDMQYKTSISWLTGETSNVLETFSIGIISTLLRDGYGSPFYRNLIESGLGTDYSANSGLDTGAKIGIFTIGLNGVKKADVPKVKEAIVKTLEEVRSNGFERNKIDGLLHQLELSLKHKTAQFGLGLMQRLSPGWFNGVDPFDELEWDKTVSAFKAKIYDGRYLETLMEKYLMNEKNFTFTMEPYGAYEDDVAVEEATRLQKKLEELEQSSGGKAESRTQLEKKELELLEVQEKARDQDLSCLPTLHVKDIERIGDNPDLRHSYVEDFPVQWREAPTNGLTYFRAINDLAKLPTELRSYVPLFTDAIMRLGTRDLTMEQLENEIRLKTGGINVGYHTSTSPLDIGQCREGFTFSGYALDENVPAIYTLIQKVVLETDFDSPEAASKIRELLQSVSSGALSSIAESGHSYARRFAAAELSPEGRLSEQLDGLSSIDFTAKLAARHSTDTLEDIIAKLKDIQQVALTKDCHFRVALTCSPESVRTNESHLSRFLSSLPPTTDTPSFRVDTPAPPSARTSKSFFPLPYQVYYTAQVFPTVPYTHPFSGPLGILAKLLTHKHLHHEIREKGGAYGGGASAAPLGGTFALSSYRDPNPLNTLKIMHEAGEWARDRAWTERDLEEAKLSEFQNVDAPRAVSSEGMGQFLLGVDHNMRQERRERLLDCTAKDIKEVADKYLVQRTERAALCVLGEKKEWVGSDWEVRSMGVMSEAVKAQADDKLEATA